MKKVYIVLTYCGTALGHIIKYKTGKKYTHVSIALDENLDNMYSFSRLNAYNCFIGGFMHEKLNQGCYKRFKKTLAKIYCIEVTDLQYDKIKEEIDYFKENKSKYKFNILGLLYILFDKEIHRENYFYCAEFVKHVLEKAHVNIKLPAMPRPDNFEDFSKAKIIYKGLLNKYNLGIS